MSVDKVPSRPGTLAGDPLTRWLLSGGVVGPLLFIVVFLIGGATRPGYSAWRNYVSDLALSNQGWEQVANFIVCGFLLIGFAVGLRRVLQAGTAAVWGPLLMGIFGLGLVVAGLFPTDPGRSYPPGAPLTGSPTTFHGWVHGINAIPVFLILGILPFILARRFAKEPVNHAWATYSRIVGAVIIVTFIAGNVIGPLGEHGLIPPLSGLVQRVQISQSAIGSAASAAGEEVLPMAPNRTATSAPTSGCTPMNPRREGIAAPGATGRGGNLTTRHSQPA